MPATRLKPLPFLEPERLIALVEQDPSLLEEGLRVVARGIPVPALAPEARIDLLAIDSEKRLNAILIAGSAGAEFLERGLGLRGWLAENLATLRAVMPGLAGCSNRLRIRILTGALVPSTESFLVQLESARPEVSLLEFFESPTGIALAVRPWAPAGAKPESRPAPAPPAARPEELKIEPPGEDPLSGIPLSAEEAAEFRKLAAHPATRRPRREPRPASEPTLAPPGAFVEN